MSRAPAPDGSWLPLLLGAGIITTLLALILTLGRLDTGDRARDSPQPTPGSSTTATATPSPTATG